MSEAETNCNQLRSSRYVAGILLPSVTPRGLWNMDHA